MVEVPPLTKDLAIRIERVMGEGYFKAAQQSREPNKQEVARFGSTIAVKAKRGHPANKVMCFGHEDIEHLDEILAFYAVDNLEPRFFLAPMNFSREMAAALSAAGFRQHDFEQAILYCLPSNTACPLPLGITIERVTADNLESYVETMAEGFEWPSAWRETAMQNVRSGFTRGQHSFLARDEGKAAGVGSLNVQDDTAGLTAGAVVPQFRRKGCHLALIHHRLYTAHELGCDLVLGGASFNSASFRNQQRAGLRMAYIESEWGR